MTGFNFTQRTRKVLAMAREEAVRLRHEYVGTEHILLGLIREGGGVGIEVLRRAGVDPRSLADQFEKVIRAGPPTARPGPNLPYTSRAKRVLDFAMKEARELNHTYVGSEHLLLGLLREEKGIAAQVLTAAGLTLEEARAEVGRILGVERPATAAESGGARPADELPIERVEVILHYRDGRRFQGSFGSPQDAIGFLRWPPQPNQDPS